MRPFPSSSPPGDDSSTPLPSAFVATDIRREAPKVILEKRNGDEEIKPAFLTLLDPKEPQFKPTATSSGRRLALANWITRKDNPFSTRVIVNRIWQHHFGNGIVPTPNDFGTLGENLPSHPELLDWLTSRFLEAGWKMKPLHRLVMNSATYRQTARREPKKTESLTDPGLTASSGASLLAASTPKNSATPCSW